MLTMNNCNAVGNQFFQCTSSSVSGVETPLWSKVEDSKHLNHVYLNPVFCLLEYVIKGMNI